MVVDALTRKSVHSLCTALSILRLKEEVKKMGIYMMRKGEAVGDLTLEPELYDEIRENQASDVKIQEWKGVLEKSEPSRFELNKDGSHRIRGRWFIPNDEELKKKIMNEAHNTLYSVHLGGDKLYKDLKKAFGWSNIKREVAEFMARCLTYQRLKG
ncbi:uncharacterized protein LOC141628791 [Silene latifolia]|uniref:uncharacterized protein LOC141628791 n=1 Tax=Silene latifolia TaxID=37657 RepID=UPI003D781563